MTMNWRAIARYSLGVFVLVAAAALVRVHAQQQGQAGGAGRPPAASAAEPTTPDPLWERVTEANPGSIAIPRYRDLLYVALPGIHEARWDANLIRHGGDG